MSIKQLSSATAIKGDDIVHTLQALNCLHALPNTEAIIKVPPKLREETKNRLKKPTLRVDVERLHYYPLAQQHR